MTYQIRRLKMIEEVAVSGEAKVIEDMEFDQARAAAVIGVYQGLKYRNKKRFVNLPLVEMVRFAESQVV